MTQISKAATKPRAKKPRSLRASWATEAPRNGQARFLLALLPCYAISAALRFHSLCVLICALLTLANTRAEAAEITVFAAASLTDSLKEISAYYEKETGDKVL